jgi:hypothetical protein
LARTVARGYWLLSIAAAAAKVLFAHRTPGRPAF